MSSKKRMKFLTVLVVAMMMFNVTAMAASVTELTGDDLSLSDSAKRQIVMLKYDYASAADSEDTDAMNSAHQKAEDIRLVEQGIYTAADGSHYTYDDVVRVAGLIDHEAATNDIDRFMVASTFVNRMHNGYWGTTTASVLSARGQYFPESDSKYCRFVNNVHSNGLTKENNRFMYIANMCLSGAFTTPSNVFGQAAGRQGVLYMYVNNKALCNNSGYFNHQYCTMFGGQSLSATDWAGRQALSANDAVNRIYELAQYAPEA